MISLHAQNLLASVSDQPLAYGKHSGTLFSEVAVKHPEYVHWARTQIPRCGTALFQLVQYAEFQLFKNQKNGVRKFNRVWRPLRMEHLVWMETRKQERGRTAHTNESGSRLTKYQFLP